MSVLDKLLDAVKLNDNYDEDEFLDDDLLDETDEDFLDEDGKPVKKFFQKFGRKKETEDDLDEFDLDEEPENRLSDIRLRRPPYRRVHRDRRSRNGRCAHPPRSLL